MGKRLYEWMRARHSDHEFSSKKSPRILTQMCFWLCNFKFSKMG